MNKSILLSLVFLFFFLVTFAQDKDSSPTTTKGTVPDITIKTIDGDSKNILDYAQNEKITVFNFWATWCIPCKRELNNLTDLYSEWQKKYDFEIVAVSVDDSRSAAKVKATIDANEWPFEILMDPNEDVKRAFNFQLIPHTIVINKEGEIGYIHSGYLDGDEFELEKEIKRMNGGEAAEMPLRNTGKKKQ